MGMKTANSSGLFAGIMTEWYRSSLNFTEQPVRYSFRALPSAFHWVSIEGNSYRKHSSVQASFSRDAPTLYSQRSLDGGRGEGAVLLRRNRVGAERSPFR